ncbi:MAG: hypothetical protein M9894_25325 [Planctomycetes bacterium]|nr:hypothetical protein [Planctomycetota bacterium]
MREAPDAYAALAERVRGVAAAEPAPTLAPLRRAGQAWGADLARDLLGVDGELLRLAELKPPLTAVELTAALAGVAAAAGDAPEGHALRVLGLAARRQEAERHARESKTWPVPFDPELLRAVELALEGPLPERYRQVAEATRYHLLAEDRAGLDGELARAEAALAVLPPYDDPMRGLVLSARERLARQLGHRAWGQPAGRRAWAARMLAACEDPHENPSDPALRRHRSRALLLGGQPPRDADLTLSKPGEKALFVAEGALGRGELDVAAAAYQELVATVDRRQEKDRVLVDALCGLAVAVAGEGDLAAARAHLAEARRAHEGGEAATLPWRTPDAAAAAVERIAEGAWAPGRGEVFPP